MLYSDENGRGVTLSSEAKTNRDEFYKLLFLLVEIFEKQASLKEDSALKFGMRAEGDLSAGTGLPNDGGISGVD